MRMPQWGWMCPAQGRCSLANSLGSQKLGEAAGSSAQRRLTPQAAASLHCKLLQLLFSFLHHITQLLRLEEELPQNAEHRLTGCCSVPACPQAPSPTLNSPETRPRAQL